MTLDELRTIVQGIETNLLAVKTAAESGLTMTGQVLQMISPQNPTTIVFNKLADPGGEILTAFTPDYLAMLTSLETAADALGTDVLHV